MSELVHLKYGYDLASNRTFRRGKVVRGNSATFDELYTYDGLHRLTSMNRGQLNGTNTGLVGNPTLTQDWSLDQTGNWNAFDQGVADGMEWYIGKKFADRIIESPVPHTPYVSTLSTRPTPRPKGPCYNLPPWLSSLDS